MPLLGHGIQTNYLILVAIVIYFIRWGRGFSIRTRLLIVVFLMLYELLQVIFEDDSVSEYLRYLIQYFYIGMILSEARIQSLIKKPIIVLKTFIFVGAYFMLDVLLVTLQYFSISQMLRSNFRFGSLTELIGDKPSLGDNQNMVAMFAIVTIALIFVCMFT